MQFNKDIILRVRDRAANSSLRKIKRETQGINRETRKTVQNIRENARATDRWRRSTARVRDTYLSLNGQVSAARAGIFALASGLGTAFVLRNVRATAEELDRIAKAGKELGSDPNFINAFQAYAEFQGVDGGKALDGLRFLNREIGKILTDQPSSADNALKVLNIEDELKNAATLEDRVATILDSIRARPEQERAGLLTGFFGRSGGELTKLLIGDAEELASTWERSVRTIGEYSEEQLKRAEALSDQVTAISNAWQSFRNNLFNSPESLGFLGSVESSLVNIRRDLEDAEGPIDALRQGWLDFLKIFQFSLTNREDLLGFLAGNPNATSKDKLEFIDQHEVAERTIDTLKRLSAESQKAIDRITTIEKPGDFGVDDARAARGFGRSNPLDARSGEDVAAKLRTALESQNNLVEEQRRATIEGAQALKDSGAKLDSAGAKQILAADALAGLPAAINSRVNAIASRASSAVAGAGPGGTGGEVGRLAVPSRPGG